MPTNRENARKHKWSKYPAAGPTPPNTPKLTLSQLDHDYDFYSRRDIHNERHRRGIAWDDHR